MSIQKKYLIKVNKFMGKLLNQEKMYAKFTVDINFLPKWGNTLSFNQKQGKKKKIVPLLKFIIIQRSIKSSKIRKRS